jgi:hypothetical protein
MWGNIVEDYTHP